MSCLLYTIYVVSFKAIRARWTQYTQKKPSNIQCDMINQTKWQVICIYLEWIIGYKKATKPGEFVIYKYIWVNANNDEGDSGENKHFYNKWCIINEQSRSVRNWMYIKCSQTEHDTLFFEQTKLFYRILHTP